MRLWSLHPRYLDARGLVALWREGLLARKVLLEETRGYRHHPQLIRFREHDTPLAAIDAYLAVVCDEAGQRGYCFDRSKISSSATSPAPIPVTRGQLLYERAHLLRKLLIRDPGRCCGILTDSGRLDAHPLFAVTEGEVEPWEIVLSKH